LGAVSKPAAAAINPLLAKGTNMSEPKSNYMAELDHWIEQSVIQPLYSAWQAGEESEVHQGHNDLRTTPLVIKAIKSKVLESYHNGQAASGRKPYQARRAFKSGN
jgi:hypothetical protein